MLECDNTILTLIDVQERLAAVMHRREELIEKLTKLICGLKLLDIPILWLEQNPDKMGPTIPELSKLLTDISPITKMSFSCCGCDEYMTALKKTRRKTVLLAGIETHVCLYQTAMDLVRKSYDVEVVADATSSRNPAEKELILTKITSGAAAGSGRHSCTTTETVLFELMKTAEHPAFRDMLKIIK